jgi:hypothetical protein
MWVSKAGTFELQKFLSNFLFKQFGRDFYRNRCATLVLAIGGVRIEF